MSSGPAAVVEQCGFLRDRQSSEGGVMNLLSLRGVRQLGLEHLTSTEQCVCVLVAQSCLTLCDPTDCSPPGSSVHGISQSRILEWVAILSSRGSS